MVLGLGTVTDLGSWRYRTVDSQFVNASWGMPRNEDDGVQPQRLYPFRVPITEADGGTVQIEVRQQDRDATTRTFTYAIPAPAVQR